MRQHGPQVSPVDALRLLAHRLVAAQSPLVSFTAQSQGFITTIEASETLKARARAIRDELVQLVAVGLAEGAGRDATDPAAQLAASLLLASWTVALIQAHRCFGHSLDTAKANGVFLALVDQGSVGVKAAMVGTPYA